MKSLFFIFISLLWVGPLWAASCCGGGSGGGVTLPKFMPAAMSLGLAEEDYQGFWNGQGEVIPDPPGSNLMQRRLNFGVGYRLSSNWQGNATTSWVANQNQYSGVSGNTQGVGDLTLGLLYENFDQITCVYQIQRPRDWLPASYFGLKLVVPTGISPYDSVTSSFDITGRGFYRFEATALVEKTIYPWSASLSGGVGWHVPRMVNQEYGKWVAPYLKQLGNRFQSGASVSYTWFLTNLDEVTLNTNLSHLQEGAARINHQLNEGTGMLRQAWGWAFSYSNAEKTWVYKTQLNQALRAQGRGTNFPITKTFSFEVTHVFH